MRECKIDGKWISFDGMSVRELEYSKEFFGKEFVYIGSGTEIRIDGIEQSNSKQEVMHFFKYA